MILLDLDKISYEILRDGCRSHLFFLERTKKWIFL